jgi:hypothetical protein
MDDSMGEIVEYAAVHESVDSTEKPDGFAECGIPLP